MGNLFFLYLAGEDYLKELTVQYRMDKYSSEVKNENLSKWILRRTWFGKVSSTIQHILLQLQSHKCGEIRKGWTSRHATSQHIFVERWCQRRKKHASNPFSKGWSRSIKYVINYAILQFAVNIYLRLLSKKLNSTDLKLKNVARESNIEK